MKSIAKKSSTTTSATTTRSRKRPFFTKAGEGGFFSPAAKTTASVVQSKMAVNKPGDKFELEADKMADKVIRMPAPMSFANKDNLQRQADDDIRRQEEEEVRTAALPEEQVQKQEEEEEVQTAALPEEQVQKQEEEEEVQTAALPEEQVQKQEEEEEVRKAALPEERVQKQEEEEEVRTAALPEERVQKQEKEEIQTASLPEERVQKQEEEEVQKAPADEDELQRKGTGTSTIDTVTQSAIHHKTAGGRQMAPDVRSYMEPRFGADFGNVRIHSDAESAGLSNRLSARAFTYQNHIFFSRDQYQPGTSEGKQLLAHELTHTIQQGHAVQRSRQVTTTTTPPPIQRLGIQDALDYFAERAYNIPGFRMLTILMGFNPINRRSTDRSAANILRALIEFMPGGRLITQALDNHGVFTRAGEWVERQLGALGDIGSDIVASLRRFLDSLSWRDIFDLGGVWERAKRIFTAPIRRLIAFGRRVVSGIMQLVKEAILRPLARMAEGTRGYDLLKAVLGQDPITGDPVPRNAETLIGGFMRLIGQEEVWRNIQRGNAVARAWAWFQGALSGLMGFVRAIPQRIVQTLRSITWQDVVTIVGVFAKVGRAFLNIAGQFISWAGRQVMSLLEIIFSVVAPAVMPYIRRARGAFRSIIRNPIGFVGNLVRAGILGFRQFARNFLTHLRASLIGWLTGTMSSANIYIPQAFNLREILKFVLSVLGLTWQNIRQKLVRAIGERAVRALETGFALVRTLVTEGPAAAWRQILEGISNLRQMVMEQIMTFVRNRVVQAAITRLVTSLNPAGAFIQAIIATYNTIMFFVERLRQIAQVAMSFINSIAAIAAGNLAAAANRVEQTMAGMLTLVISFLARIAGLGNVARAVTNIINRVRRPIDRALDRVVAWIVRQARRLGRFVAQAGVSNDPNERLRLGKQAAVATVNRFAGRRVGNTVLRPLLAAIKIRYGFSQLDVVSRNGRWFVFGVINPRFDEASDALTPEGVAPAEGESTLLAGEGNFSFALSIAAKVEIGGRMVATDYIVQERKTLRKTRAQERSEALTQSNINALLDMGVEVERQVNATDPRSYPDGIYDTIVFNHPLVLTRRSEVTEEGSMRTRTVRTGETANRALIEDFFNAAKQNIRSGGRIIIISSRYRLQRWRLDEMASRLGMEQQVMTFLASNFPGYTHERTERPGGAGTVQTREQFAIVFTITASKSE